MRIVTVHNTYQQPGGEDVVFQSEAALLEAHGHEVLRYVASNRDIHDDRLLSLASAASKTIWNGASLRDARALIRRARPDLIHVHNTFPLISPTVYYSARAEGVPVVQTLHNFRLLCPSATLRRNGQVCEACIGTSTRWPGVVHGCYRDSRLATGVVAAMLTTHRLLGTWRDRVDRYIAISEFARDKFLQGGWPAEKVVVKPNFLDADPGVRARRAGDDYVLFVGRLTEEKGLTTLLDALRRMHSPPLLKVVGQGPLMPADPSADHRVQWLGQQPRDQVLQLMKGASVLIVPSEWYEIGTLTVIEAFATGVPVIASRLGTLAEMVVDGVTGLLFTAKDPDALTGRIEWALSHRSEMDAIAARARKEFDRKYTPEGNYRALMDIYRAVLHSLPRPTRDGVASGLTPESVGRIGVHT